MSPPVLLGSPGGGAGRAVRAGGVALRRGRAGRAVAGLARCRCLRVLLQLADDLGAVGGDGPSELLCAGELRG